MICLSARGAFLLAVQKWAPRRDFYWAGCGCGCGGGEPINTRRSFDTCSCLAGGHCSRKCANANLRRDRCANFATHFYFAEAIRDQSPPRILSAALGPSPFHRPVQTVWFRGDTCRMAVVCSPEKEQPCRVLHPTFENASIGSALCQC